MKKSITFFTTLFFITVGYSQLADTARFNPMRIDMNERYWSINFNTGFQHRYFLGAGLSKNYFIGSPHGNYGYDIYSSFAVFPAFKSLQKTIIAVNIGAMACGNGGVLGIEVKYLKAKNIEDIMIIPKIGIGFNMLHATYGYAFSTNKYPIEGIRKNVFALQFNLPFYTKNLLKGKQENK